MSITPAYTVAPSTGTPGMVGGVDLGSASGFARPGWGWRPPWSPRLTSGRASIGRVARFGARGASRVEVRMETVKVVPTRNRPLFGPDWPNPPHEDSPSSVRRVPKRTPVEAAAEHRAYAIGEVLRLAEDADTALEGLLAWMGETPWTSHLEDARRILGRVLEHHELEAGGHLG